MFVSWCTYDELTKFWKVKHPKQWNYHSPFERKESFDGKANVRVSPITTMKWEVRCHKSNWQEDYYMQKKKKKKKVLFQRYSFSDMN